ADAPAVGVVLRWSVKAITRPRLVLPYLDLAVLLAQSVVAFAAWWIFVETVRAGVEEGNVDGVDVTLERLHVAANADRFGYATVWRHVAGVVRERRRNLTRTQVCPDNIVALDARAGGRFHVRF